MPTRTGQRYPHGNTGYPHSMPDHTAAIDQAHALIAGGLSANKAAAIVAEPLGVSARTVQAWAQKAGTPLGDAAHEASKKAREVADAEYQALRARMRVLASQRALEALEDMPDWKPRDRQALAMVFAILLDKVRLEEGKSTSRSEVVPVDQAAETIRAFLEETEAHANGETR